MMKMVGSYYQCQNQRGKLHSYQPFKRWSGDSISENFNKTGYHIDVTSYCLYKDGLSS